MNLLKIRLGSAERLVKFEKSGLIYETDFTGLDLSTGIDTPIRGKPMKWNISGTIRKETRTIDGVVYNVLFIGSGASITLTENLYTKYPDVFTVEATTYKDDYNSGSWGALYAPSGCPNYNTWSSGRGISATNEWDPVNTIRYNGFGSYSHDDCVYGDWYDHTNVKQIITGGITNRVNDGLTKKYLAGKKALSISNRTFSDQSTVFATSNSYGGMTFCVLGFRIYNTDRFEEME